MATYAPTPDATQHEEVDFMTMFTNQNDDAPEGADTKQPSAAETTAPTLPNVDPLQVFDAPAPADAWQQSNGHAQAYAGQQQPNSMQLHMPPGAMAPVSYPSHMMYHHPQPPLGQPFMPPHVAPPMAQYVEPSSLPGANAQQGFSAFTAPAPAAAAAAPTADGNATTTTSNPATPAPAANGSPSSAAIAKGSSPSASGSTSPNGQNTTAAGRRKRKLTPEDKRRICEIYRNSQGKIRQEDIAKEYSVDRSTISKILNQEDRWLDPEQSGANAGMSRRPGGRYPAIEEDIHRWLDEAVMMGREVRDSEAREQALKIGLRLGHPHFQASSKWWDGVKRRRLEEGRAMPTARRQTTAARVSAPVMPGLVRTYTMDMPPTQSFPMAGANGYALMDPNVYAATAGGMMAMPPAMRARSQSSPQMFNGYVAAPGQQTPSSGPAPRQRMSPPRHSPVTPLSRNRSYHGSSTHSSPVGRPSPLHRASSSHGGRPSPHLRLGASAFGLTPMSEQQQQQGVHTPTQPGSMADIQQHHGTTTPTATSGASMPSLSPLSVSMSESSDAPTVPTAALSPSTPCTPAQPTFVVPNQPEYMDLASGGHCQPQPLIYNHPHPQMMVGGYHGAPFSTPPMYPGYEYVQGQW